MLTAKEVAEALKVSIPWVYRNKRALGGQISHGATVRFPENRIEQIRKGEYASLDAKREMAANADDPRPRQNQVLPCEDSGKKWETEQSAEAWEAQATPPLSACWLDFATAYLRMAQERFSQKTWHEKKRAFRASMRHIPPESSVDAITSRHALDVRRSAAIISANAANKIRKNFAAAWTWARRYYGLPHENPFLVVERFPADQTQRYVPPEEDFWKENEVTDDADKAFLLFLLHTGARRAKAFRLTWDNVDFSGRKIRLATRKTAEQGMMYAWTPMTAALRSILEGQKERARGDLVFTKRRNGKPYTARQHMMPLLCARPE